MKPKSSAQNRPAEVPSQVIDFACVREFAEVQNYFSKPLISLKVACVGESPPYPLCAHARLEGCACAHLGHGLGGLA